MGDLEVLKHSIRGLCDRAIVLIEELPDSKFEMFVGTDISGVSVCGEWELKLSIDKKED